MARSLTSTRKPSRTARITVSIAVCTIIATCVAYVVWFMGLDPYWAAASVLAVGPVAAVLAGLGFEDEDAPWDPPARETPRGSRITVAIIEESLAACERLARPSALRRVRAFLTPERDDRLARTTVVRRMRALLLAELHNTKLDPLNDLHHEAIAARLGRDAITILQPTESNPVTTAAIARCLDVVEQLGGEPQKSQ